MSDHAKTMRRWVGWCRVEEQHGGSVPPPPRVSRHDVERALAASSEWTCHGEQISVRWIREWLRLPHEPAIIAEIARHVLDIADDETRIGGCQPIQLSPTNLLLTEALARLAEYATTWGHAEWERLEQSV